MKKGLYQIFSERLKAAIRDWGGPEGSIRLFSDTIDIPNNTMYTYTAGQSLPSLVNLYTICDFLDVSADWLLGLTDVKERKNYSPYSE